MLRALRLTLLVSALSHVLTQPSPSVSGTPAASISGTPAASLSGTPAMSVTGTPAASISGTPAASISGTPGVSHTPTRSAVHAANTSTPANSSAPSPSPSTQAAKASPSPVTLSSPALPSASAWPSIAPEQRAAVREVRMQVSISGASVAEVLLGPVVQAIRNSTATALRVAIDDVVITGAAETRASSRILRLLQVAQSVVVLNITVRTTAAAVDTIASAARTLSSNTAVSSSIATALAVATNRSPTSFTVTPIASSVSVAAPFQAAASTAPSSSSGEDNRVRDILLGVLVGGVGGVLVLIGLFFAVRACTASKRPVTPVPSQGYAPEPQVQYMNATFNPRRL